jgi:hypothetical protein
MMDGQKLLVMNVTLKSPQLLAQGTMLLSHTFDLLLKGFDLTCISTEMTMMSSNDVLGVVLGISRHIRPTSMVVVLKDIACLIHACHPL